jgi:hypothetical protein
MVLLPKFEENPRDHGGSDFSKALGLPSIGKKTASLQRSTILPHFRVLSE